MPDTGTLIGGRDEVGAFRGKCGPFSRIAPYSNWTRRSLRFFLFPGRCFATAYLTYPSKRSALCKSSGGRIIFVHPPLGYSDEGRSKQNDAPIFQIAECQPEKGNYSSQVFVIDIHPTHYNSLRNAEVVPADSMKSAEFPRNQTKYHSA